MYLDRVIARAIGIDVPQRCRRRRERFDTQTWPPL